MKKKVVEDVIGDGGWENVDRTDGELRSCMGGRRGRWLVAPHLDRKKSF